MASRIGNGFKTVTGKDGKTRLISDKKARMAKLDVSTRLKVEAKEKTKVTYKRGK